MSKISSKYNKLNNKSSGSKRNVRKIVYWILAIICMVVIFIFSSRNGDDSTDDSHAIGMAVGYVTIDDFSTWSYQEQESYAVSIDHPVRKTAHFIEYALLGFLLVGASFDTKHRWYKNTFIPFGIGAVYSMTDEFHQTFTSERSGQITDVLLDSSGVLSGVVLCFVCFIILNMLNSRKAK